jgi:phosphatidylglycerophosphate synthase
MLAPIARGLIAAGVTANGVTAVALALGLAGGVLLASGRFGAAAALIVLASLGDALDGVLARVSKTASSAGAIFDAAADRYQEMAILAGLAIHLRGDVASLSLVLGALLASFMVSYGSAKAEALGVPVPRGIMRRAERAVFLGVGVTAVPIAGAVTHLLALPAWVEASPIVAALAVVAVVANVSAARRIHIIARSTSPRAAARARAAQPEVARESTADAAE